MIELNLAAKTSALKYEANIRRNKMRQWRKQKQLIFNSKANLDDWLTYTKWHKRPMDIKDQFGMILVTFLDHKGA